MEARAWHQNALTRPPKVPTPPHETPYPQEYLERLEDALAALTLGSERAERTAAAMSKIFQRNLRRPLGSQDILSLSAPFSAGKSTFAIRWGSQIHCQLLGNTPATATPSWNPSRDVAADLVPVVYVTLISDSGAKELNAQILSFLGYSSEGTTRATANRVVTALGRHGVRLLILDDVHMLRLREKASRNVLDYLKFLNTELGSLNGTLMLVGADIDNSQILADPQIKGRLRSFRLDPYTITTKASAREWQHFLRAAEEQLLPVIPWVEPGIFSSTHAGLLYQRTQGFPGDAAQLLTDLVLAIATTGKQTITSEDIEAVTLSARAQEGQAGFDDFLKQ